VLLPFVVLLLSHVGEEENRQIVLCISTVSFRRDVAGGVPEQSLSGGT
jgi:hypothetical protein